MLLVVGCSGIGKTTLSKKNSLFIDLDSDYNFCFYNKKNKILLINYKNRKFSNYRKNILYLDISSVYDVLIKRIKKKF